MTYAARQLPLPAFSIAAMPPPAGLPRPGVRDIGNIYYDAGQCWSTRHVYGRPRRRHEMAISCAQQSSIDGQEEA